MKFSRVSLVTSAAVLAGVLVISGCVADPAALEETKPSGFVAIDDYRSQDVSWEACEESWLLASPSAVMWSSVVDCASIRVPGSYDESVTTPDFTIAMMRVRASEEVEDVIFINPGGPGGSGVEQVQTSDFPADILEQYAFIGFDPRGVGKSTFVDGTTIKCSDELDYLSYFGEASPASEAELDESVLENDLYYEDCVANNPYWWTLSTARVVDDLDVMREVVTPGRPLNFIGSSYGTTIAGRYVTTYPETVGKIVFDSPTTVDTDRIGSRIKNLAAAE